MNLAILDEDGLSYEWRAFPCSIMLSLLCLFHSIISYPVPVSSFVSQPRAAIEETYEEVVSGKQICTFWKKNIS